MRKRFTEEEKNERKAVKRIDVLRKCVGKRAFEKDVKDIDTFSGFEFYNLNVGDVMDLVPKEKNFS